MHICIYTHTFSMQDINSQTLNLTQTEGVLGHRGTPGWDTGRDKGGTWDPLGDVLRKTENKYSTTLFHECFHEFARKKVYATKKRLCHTTQCSRGMGQERTRSGKRVGRTWSGTPHIDFLEAWKELKGFAPFLGHFHHHYLQLSQGVGAHNTFAPVPRTP